MDNEQRVMVCGHCGHSDCYEAEQIDKRSFVAKHMDYEFAACNHRDERARWQSASRKIVEAEIAGYEKEFAALNMENALGWRHNKLKIVSGQIDALKKLAEKFQ